MSLRGSVTALNVIVAQREARIAELTEALENLLDSGAQCNLEQCCHWCGAQYKRVSHAKWDVKHSEYCPYMAALAVLKPPTEGTL
jgi:hypothetical protein